MMKITTNGLVIKEQTTGESDRLVTLLTADYGIVRAFVRRAKLAKSRSAGATSLFAYSRFSLYRSRDAFTADDAEPIEVFFDLRKDLSALALAQYFAQLAYDMGDEGQPCGELLRLLLNSLHLLCSGKKQKRLIKAVFELKSACFGGYMPDIAACASCGTYESGAMFFDVAEGCFYCASCAHGGAQQVTAGVADAMRFICYSPQEKIFSFSLPEQELRQLGELAEKYVLSLVQRRLTALEFYKGIADENE